MARWIPPDLTLSHNGVQLLPLEAHHRNDLLRAASDGQLWELWYTSVPSATTIEAYLQTALEQRDKGTAMPFVVVDQEAQQVIGSTRFCRMQPQHRRLEIGYTWYAQRFQRTRVNTTCKYLLLRYAFEELNCIAVEFMTNWFNLPSRAAIARLGAKQDGVLRNHRINADGSYRDSVVFSITEQEWAGVRNSLEYRMKRGFR